MLGLAEVVFTPVEAGTRSSLYTVTFCYNSNGVLQTVEEQGTTLPPATPTSASASDPMPHDASPPTTPVATGAAPAQHLEARGCSGKAWRLAINANTRRFWYGPDA
jgi:hypothetical protein